MKDKEFKAEFERLRPEFESVEKLVKLKGESKC